VSIYNRKHKYKMRANQFITETALADLEKHLPSHLKHGHRALVDLIHRVAIKHNIADDILHDMFKRKHHKSPLDLLKGELTEDDQSSQIQDFIQWSIKTLNLHEPIPEITLSKDSEVARKGHHTGVNMPHENKIWVYVGNRNLVDIMRTVFHELVHARQYQLGMIEDGDSYPGSPIEVLADAMAGKYIKVYGKEHPEIFQ